jgi:hypothetical protein
MARHSLAVALLALLSGCSGCKPKATRVPPLCSFDMVSEQERKNKALEPMVWLKVISPSVDPETMKREGELQSACGQVHERVQDDPAFDCPGFNLGAERVDNDIVELDDLVLSEAGEGRVLLWAATDELVGGESEGTAAMAVWGDKGLEIHAVGALRGYRQAARMRLHAIGDVPVLLLESDRCNSVGDCTRIAQVVPIINKRLQEIPVWEAGRGCIGRAQFALAKKTERPFGGGWARRFALTRTIELAEGGGVVITDLVSMEDYEQANPDAPARPFRKIDSRRPLQLGQNRFEFYDEDLWERSLRDFGSAQSSPAQ